MNTIITLVYKPIGIVAGILAGLLSQRVFTFIWGKIDEEEAPKPNTEWAGWGKILTAAALQGMVFRVVRALVDRNLARLTRYLTGVWPGERTPDRA